MTDTKGEVEAWVRTAAIAALGAAGDTDPVIRPADAKFGDYQANLAMSLGKRLNRTPRELAQLITEQLLSGEARAWIAQATVAGPGFINLKLSSAYVDARLQRLFDDPRLGVPPQTQAATVVIDYSSPNLAKEMHIGHLRSTIIGDALCRILQFRGDRVIRHNHLGDWGTQFGMLLEHLFDTEGAESESFDIRDLNLLYQAAKVRFDTDPAFSERSRQRVVALQAGEPQALTLWRRLIDESVRHMNAVYCKLGVLLEPQDIVPESFYNSRLHSIVDDLRASGVLLESQGAQVVFPAGFKNKEGEPLPLIVQKKDSGFGYAATDLAAARYRITELGAQRLIYVVDARQTEHFQMLFWSLRAAGWAGTDVQLDYVPFGTILGEDRKPFKTRSGGTVRLVEVLDEAIQRARQVIESKSPDLEETTKQEIAFAVGIGAVKYADLSSERIKDYLFDYDRMLALEGNTAPYLQNAYVRVQAIFRRGEVATEHLSGGDLHVTHDAERALALRLFQLPQVIESVAVSLEPHRLCNYLYELASEYHTFYERCRVLNAATEAERTSRLGLCRLVAGTLKLGLELLGMRVPEQM